jgi:hypothetical protein
MDVEDLMADSVYTGVHAVTMALHLATRPFSDARRSLLYERLDALLALIPGRIHVCADGVCLEHRHCGRLG